MITEIVDTPFGAATLELWAITGGRAAVLREKPAKPYGERRDTREIKALLYGAKTLGATRIVELVRAVDLDRLLADDSLVVPHDLIDLTHGRYLTFFEGKGYGFLPQQEPFCPEMRAAAIPAARAVNAGSAARAIVAAVEYAADAIVAADWGAHLMGKAISPTAYLARELELCYLPLCQIGHPAGIDDVVADILARLSAERTCPCTTAMRPSRERGLIGEDWRTWI